MNVLENTVLLLIGSVAGIAVAAVIVAALAQSWLNRQYQGLSQRLRADLGEDLAAARKELEAFAKRLSVQVMAAAQAEQGEPAHPVDAKTVAAAETVHMGLSGWIKALSTVASEPASELRTSDGSPGSAIEARLEVYFEEGKAAFFQARQLAGDVRTQALYLERDVHEVLDGVADTALTLSRDLYLAAKSCREAQHSAQMREFQRSLSQVETSRTALAEYCNGTVVPLLRDNLAPRFRAMRDRFAARQLQNA